MVLNPWFTVARILLQPPFSWNDKVVVQSFLLETFTQKEVQWMGNKKKKSLTFQFKEKEAPKEGGDAELLKRTARLIEIYTVQLQFKFLLKHTL